MLSNPFQRMSAGRFFFMLGLFSGAVVTTVVNLATAEPSASPERAAAAVGHYARARALLAQALSEFEEGRKLARPDLLLDPEEWRISVISRAEELNRVLDPQPRVTRSGARFEAATDLIRKEGEKPAAVSLPKRAPAVVHKPTKASTKAPAVKKPIAPIIKAGPTSEPRVSPAEVTAPPIESPKAEDSPIPAVQPPAPPVEAAMAPEEPLKEPAPEVTGDTAPSAAPAGTAKEDPEIAEAINKAIKERLERMSREGSPQEEPGK